MQRPTHVFVRLNLIKIIGSAWADLARTTRKLFGEQRWAPQPSEPTIGATVLTAPPPGYLTVIRKLNISLEYQDEDSGLSSRLS